LNGENLGAFGSERVNVEDLWAFDGDRVNVGDLWAFYGERVNVGDLWAGGRELVIEKCWILLVKRRFLTGCTTKKEGRLNPENCPMAQTMDL